MYQAAAHWKEEAGWPPTPPTSVQPRPTMQGEKSRLAPWLEYPGEKRKFLGTKRRFQWVPSARATCAVGKPKSCKKS